MEAIGLVLSAVRELPVVTSETERPKLMVRQAGFASPELIWRVPLPGCGPVYMSAQAAPAGVEYDEDRFVVMAQTAQLYGAWWAAEVAFCGQEARARAPAQITRDRKWKDQGPNWEYGLARPVPLPEVGYHPSAGVRFVDGVTRTLWLTHHRTAIIPMLVRGAGSAHGLHTLVGDLLQPPRSVADLVKAVGSSDLA